MYIQGPHVYREQVLEFVTWMIGRGHRARKSSGDPNIMALIQVEAKWESIRHQPNDKDFIILTKGLIPFAREWNRVRPRTSPAPKPVKRPVKHGTV